MILFRGLRVPMPVIRDQPGRSSYLRNIAPAEIITTMQQRQWTEPPGGPVVLAEKT